jgi:transposase InsO family protein
MHAKVFDVGVDSSFGSRRVTRALEKILVERAKPLAPRCDNGPEFTSRHFLLWCIERRIELVHIPPGKPQQNGYVESFHGEPRDECLNVSWFENLWMRGGRSPRGSRSTPRNGRTVRWAIRRQQSSHGNALLALAESRVARRSQSKESLYRVSMSYDSPSG